VKSKDLMLMVIGAAVFVVVERVVSRMLAGSKLDENGIPPPRAMRSPGL